MAKAWATQLTSGPEDDFNCAHDKRLSWLPAQRRAWATELERINKPNEDASSISRNDDKRLPRLLAMPGLEPASWSAYPYCILNRIVRWH